MARQITEKRTQAERTSASKKRIILEATRLFGEKGFNSTRLSDIAMASEMTEPGILHHFHNKENLLIKVLEERDRIDMENYLRFIDEHKLDLFGAVKSLVAQNQKNPHIIQLFTMLVAESIPTNRPGHGFFVERYTTVKKALCSILETLQEKGEIRQNISCENLAIILLALMDGLQIQWLLEPEKINMTEIFNQYLDLLLTSISPAV